MEKNKKPQPRPNKSYQLDQMRQLLQLSRTGWYDLDFYTMGPHSTTEPPQFITTTIVTSLTQAQRTRP